MAPPTKAKAPRPPVLPKQLEPRSQAALDDREAIEQGLLEAPALEGQRAERVTLDGVRVAGGSFSKSILTSFTLLDVALDRTDASLAEWPAADLTRVELTGCRLLGMKLVEARLENVRFTECHLEYASFADARFRQVTFHSCRLREADFRGADLTGVVFDTCDLTGADLSAAKLAGADVSSSEVSELRVRVQDVSGLVVSREQTSLFARVFGLVVRD